MTRINLVSPVELYDQHLLAEYREIRSLTKGLQRCFRGKNGIRKSRIPKQFTLNKGHVLFFADKGLYINNRYKQILSELEDRGFVPQHSTIDTSIWPEGYFNDWIPTKADLVLIRTRINKKIALKPSWYRYYGEHIHNE